MRQNIPWTKLSIEAFVIVGSILLAFAIDAWGEERTDRRDERIALSRLHSEFQNSTERMGTGDINRLTATIDIYNILQSHQDQRLPQRVPNSLIVQMLGVPTFDRVTPVLDGLVQSGNLSLIQDEGVISSISIWQRNLIQLSEAQQDARRATYELLIPALSTRGNLGIPLSVYPPSIRSNPISGESLLKVDNEIIGLVADRVKYLESTSINRERLISSTQDVIRAIELAEEY